MLNSHRHTTTPTSATSAATMAVATPPAHNWRASTTGRVCARPEGPWSGSIGLVISHLVLDRNGSLTAGRHCTALPGVPGRKRRPPGPNTGCSMVRRFARPSLEQENVVTKVRDGMTAEPIVLQQDQSIADAAQAMRDNAVGAVLVVDGDKLCGRVTDRDIVVRAVAESASPDSPVGRVVSPDLVAVAADDETATAAQVMQDNAVRRLPVLEDGRIVGIVSIGDLAVSQGEDSARAHISAAEPNE